MALLEHKAFLEADEDARVVEPDQVVCRRCDREVRLCKGRAYALFIGIYDDTTSILSCYCFLL